MREKKWVDCPICGATKSMHKQSRLTEKVKLAKYPPLEVHGLDGQFCDRCGDGFWSIKSERKLSREAAEHMAKHDSVRVVAADIASVKEAAKMMKVTPQGVHKMMNDGRLRFVIAGGLRLPIRQDLLLHAKARRRVRASV